ncbi:reverse transcriptase domain protein [Orientia tsutsugamushi str. UT144]|uniref:Reverse transcriptase domain protein n=1 Tax=Orientia tsutsugamushi str. UT144 TaxID=1441384 RepID=A0A0F3RKE7_ORITS|nr:reverse transcriptase domain protein [Orientia tsutsugamushi str. UT144]
MDQLSWYIDNKRRVSSFINQSTRVIYNWFNRMGGKRKVNWKRLTEILKRINFPKIGKIISMF